MDVSTADTQDSLLEVKSESWWSSISFMVFWTPEWMRLSWYTFLHMVCNHFLLHGKWWDHGRLFPTLRNVGKRKGQLCPAACESDSECRYRTKTKKESTSCPLNLHSAWLMGAAIEGCNGTGVKRQDLQLMDSWVNRPSMSWVLPHADWQSESRSATRQRVSPNVGCSGKTCTNEWSFTQQALHSCNGTSCNLHVLHLTSVRW
jgi:hypothetical protein